MTQEKRQLTLHHSVGRGTRLLGARQEDTEAIQALRQRPGPAFVWSGILGFWMIRRSVGLDQCPVDPEWVAAELAKHGLEVILDI